MNSSVVIIGAGQAAAQALISLRAGGFEGAITLIGAEQALPYQRPPLSKAFLAGEMAAPRLNLRPEAFYAQKQIKLHLDDPVAVLDRAEKKIITASGAQFAYDVAVIATGGQPRRLNCRGCDLEGVHYLHDLAQSLNLKKELDMGARRLVVIGGGYIGLEVAATARKRGLEVMILEAAARILGRVAAPEISDFFTKLHEQHGVGVKTRAQVAELVGDKNISAVRDQKKGDFPADMALVGVGFIPDTQLAEAAGLEVENGILVDGEMRSSDKSIYAIGDCANALLPLYDEPVRLESVQNAIYQAKIAAASICGAPPPPVEAPWFWSDQYDAKLQIAGLARSYDRTILRGAIETQSFVLFYLSGDRLLAADCVNRPQEFLLSRRVIGQRAAIAPARLADDSLAPQEAFAP